MAYERAQMDPIYQDFTKGPPTTFEEFDVLTGTTGVPDVFRMTTETAGRIFPFSRDTILNYEGIDSIQAPISYGVTIAAPSFVYGPETVNSEDYLGYWDFYATEVFGAGVPPRKWVRTKGKDGRKEKKLSSSYKWWQNHPEITEPYEIVVVTKPDVRYPAAGTGEPLTVTSVFLNDGIIGFDQNLDTTFDIVGYAPTPENPLVIL